MNKIVLIALPCLHLGGTEYQTLNLVKALKSKGYIVTVFCYFEYDVRMVSYMQKAGACVELMTLSGIRPKVFLTLIKILSVGIYKALKKNRPTIVHVQYMAPGSLAILLFKLLGTKKIIATAHVPGHIYKQKWIPKVISKCLVNTFLTVSKSSERSFFDEEPKIFNKALFNTGRKHFTIYNCVELKDKSVAQKKVTFYIIGIVSRLSYEKGIDIMLNAMPEIIKQYPATKLLIVGDGREKEDLSQLATKLGINHAITWAGLQPKNQLETYYRQMDIVVVPSRFEGFGLTAIEAMSYSIPVVASAVDGLDEVIQNGKSGILVQKEKPELLAKAILNLMQDETTRNTIAIAGKKRVEDTFSYANYKHQISELYEAVLLDNH